MRCSFCGMEFYNCGKIYVKKDGTVYKFCSRRCEKNMLELKRNPRKVKWTLAYSKTKKLKKKKG